MSNTSIALKLIGGFSAVVTIVLMIATFAFWNANSNKSHFGEYRSTARTTNASAELASAIMAMRLEVMKFRAGNSTDMVTPIESDAKRGLAAIRQLASINPQTDFSGVEQGILAYRNNVLKANQLQNQRHGLVQGTLEPTGVAARKTITKIMDTAYKDQNSNAAYSAARVQQNLMLARFYTADFLLTNRNASLERANKELGVVKEEMTKLSGALSDQHLISLTAEAAALVSTYEDNVQQVAEAIFARNDIFDTRLDVIGPEVMAAAQESALEQRRLQDTIGPILSRQFERQSWIVVAIGLAGTAIAIALGFGLTRSLSTPIVELTTAMKSLADRDMETQIPHRQRGDELGSMAAAVEVFKSSMIETERLHALQAEDHAKRAERQDRIEQAIASFKSSSEEDLGAVLTAADEMLACSRTLNTTSEDTIDLSDGVSNASSDAAMNVETVAGAAEELSASIQEIAGQISSSTAISGQAVESSRKTRQDMENLSAKAQSIGQVVSLIREIAEQTNLLALNATIEAARSGEAGRGFAVVASEVKELAGQTAKATDQISNEVLAIQDATSVSVASINEISSVIGRLNEIATSVASSIEEQGAATAEIASNAQQAAQGTIAVAGDVNQVREAARSNGEASARVKSTSELMKTKSDFMRTRMAEFLNTIRAA